MGFIRMYFKYFNVLLFFRISFLFIAFFACTIYVYDVFQFLANVWEFNSTNPNAWSSLCPLKMLCLFTGTVSVFLSWLCAPSVIGWSMLEGVGVCIMLLLIIEFKQRLPRSFYRGTYEPWTFTILMHSARNFAFTYNKRDIYMSTVWRWWCFYSAHFWDVFVSPHWILDLGMTGKQHRHKNSNNNQHDWVNLK